MENNAIVIRDILLPTEISSRLNAMTDTRMVEVLEHALQKWETGKVSEKVDPVNLVPNKVAVLRIPTVLDNKISDFAAQQSVGFNVGLRMLFNSAFLASGNVRKQTHDSYLIDDELTCLAARADDFNDS